MNPKLIVVIVLAAVFLLFASVVPMPDYGVQEYNLEVATQLSETCVAFVCSYSVVSMDTTNVGGATLIDWGGWFGQGLSIGACVIGCTYKLTVCYQTSCAVASETKFIGNVGNYNSQDTVTQTLSYLPPGTDYITAILTLNGATEATGFANACVGPVGPSGCPT